MRIYQRAIVCALLILVVVYCFAQPGPVLRNGLGLLVNGGLVGTQPSLNFALGTGMLLPCTNNVGQNRVDCNPAPNPSIFANHDQLRGAEDACNSSNGTTVYTCNMANKALASLTPNMRVMLIVDVPCPTSCSLIIDSNANVNIKKADCATDPGGDIVPTQAQWLFYNGTFFCMMSDAEAVSNFKTNISSVTVNANVSTDQNLMAVTLPAGKVSILNRTLRIVGAGIYSTNPTTPSTVTVKAKLCSVSGCGSGTVLTLASFVSGNAGTAQLNAPFHFILMSTTQTIGASSAYEAHGDLVIDLGSLVTGATVLADSNSTSVGTIDATAQMFLQITAAFGSASASNSISQRQMTVEVLN